MSESTKKICVVFAGGGTGGHIYPGIAVADALMSMARERKLELEIHWIGNKKGMDSSIIEKNLVSAGGSISAFHGISCGKLRRYLSFKNLTDVFRIIAGYFQSLRLLKELKPDCLFSKGGFVSVTPCRAAKRLGIPYFTHECDFTPGLATRLNSKGARKVLVSYKETADRMALRGISAVVTGNPVRPVFYTDNSAKGLDFLHIAGEHEKPVLLVLGGSLGALQVNNLIVENLDWLKEHFIVVHQTGKAFAEANPQIFKAPLADSDYHPFDFIHAEMPSVVQAADVVVSRSGANSLWECAVCAKPMVLIPLCGSGTRGDQVDNARYFESREAAVMLAGEAAVWPNLQKALEKFGDKEMRRKYAANCRSVTGQEKPAVLIAQIVLEQALGGK